MSRPVRRATPPPSGARRTDWRPIAAAAVPALATLLAIVVYQVDVPFQDSWELVPLLARRAEGSLGLGELWAQHNEHRIFFPRLAMLGLALVTGWSTLAECLVTWLLLVLLLVAFARIAASAAREAGWPCPPWLVPAGAVVVFSLAQYENLLWGWQMTVALSVAGVVGAIAILTAPAPGAAGVGAALALAVLATGSFANGLLVWPIGAALIVAAPSLRGDPRRRVGFAGAWVVAGAAAVAAYLSGYVKPAEHPPFTVSVGPLIQYVLAYLGEPLWFSAPGQWTGVFGVGLLGAAAIGLVRGGTPLVALRAPLAMAAYAIGCALVTAVGRADWGTEQATASRYASFAAWLWLADLALLSSWAQALAAVERPALARAARAACLAITALYLATSVRATADMATWQATFEPARAALARGPDGLDPRVAGFLHEHPEVLAEYITTARRLGVGPYRR